jgi:hypothetical protein
MRFRRLAIAVTGLALLAGCPQEAGERPSPGAVTLDERRVVITGPVGLGSEEIEASYALLEARNTSERDIVAAVGGHLVDGAGATLGPASAEVLRIPAGGSRMFALVDQERRRLPSAAGVEAEVVAARFARRAPVVTVSGGMVHGDGGRAVAEGYVESSGRGAATVVVIAGFYDRAGAPLMRRATAFRLDAGARRAVQLVGPEGSASASLFLGDVGY